VRPPDDDPDRDSYYARTAGPAPHYAPLDGDVACDVGVVGGGLAGLSAAIELAQRGLAVRVLEAVEVGAGASGRNGGQVLPGLSCEMSVVEQQLDRGAARRIFDLTVAGVDLVRERRRAFAIDCDWRDGALAVAVGASKARALREECEAIARDYGYDRVRMIGADALRDWVDSPRYAAAAFDAGAGHLHPLKYTRGLARAATALGASIHERSRVVGLEPGTRPVLRTATGSVRCRHVLLAGNVYLDRLAPSLARRIMPVGTYIAVTEPLGGARAARLIPSAAAVFDTQLVLDYFRLSADDRLLFGGRVSYGGARPADLDASMHRRMLAVFPQLADVRFDAIWGGYIDITVNRAPDFGRLTPEIYYLQGFSGHGVALSGIAGRLAAEAIAGQAERFDLFARLRHRDFPGGRALRTPALVLAMLWYRLRDLI